MEIFTEDLPSSFIEEVRKERLELAIPNDYVAYAQSTISVIIKLLSDKSKYPALKKQLKPDDINDIIKAAIRSHFFIYNFINAPESMYVVLADSTGQTAAVYHHDNPYAVLIDTWAEWTIDLQEFADQGMVLNNVDSITIGFGNRNDPETGGSGKMYFDDIRLYRPIPQEPES